MKVPVVVGVPTSWADLLRVIPFGRVPDAVTVALGKPLVRMLNVLAAPIVKAVLFRFVNCGAEFTVSVKD